MSYDFEEENELEETEYEIERRIRQIIVENEEDESWRIPREDELDF